jgi:hypothetical protein
LDHIKTCISNLGRIKTTRIFYFFILFLSGILIITCKSLNKDKDKKAVARVYDMYLYEADIVDIVPKGTSELDSASLVSKFINNWIKEKLLVKKAEDNLTEESKDLQSIEKKLQDYRNSLITYAYERELVRQKLDTVVGDDEIQKYYNENQNNFELKDNIIKVLYVKVSKKAPDIEKLKRWYKSDNNDDKNSLDSYCHQYAENYYLDDNTWLFFDDLLKEIPIETYNKELFLKNNRFVEVQDSLSLYFLNIKGFKIKNSISPLGFEKDNIQKIILNKRKLHLISQMKDDVYNDALANNKIEIYK